MPEREREQSKLPYILLAAFCLSLMMLGAAITYSRQPLRFDFPLVSGRDSSRILSDARILPEVSVRGSMLAETPFRVPILMYHRVGQLQLNASSLDRDLTVRPEDFEGQVKYFKAGGYRSVTLAQVLKRMQTKDSLDPAFPEKPIVFSFDDGWEDAFDNAVPVLLREGFTGTFAVAGSLVGRPGYASWEDVLNAQSLGMEIISHSDNHLDLTNKIYSAEDLARETAGAKQELERKLGRRVEIYAYPYGKYDERSIRFLKEAGFRMGLTTQYGQSLTEGTIFTAPRVRVHGQDGLEKLKRIFGPTAGRTVSFGLNP